MKKASGPKCQSSATHRATAGCVHEHIIVGYVCGQHVDELADGAINCVTCYNADRHICPLLGRVEPAAARS